MGVGSVYAYAKTIDSRCFHPGAGSKVMAGQVWDAVSRARAPSSCGLSPLPQLYSVCKLTFFSGRGLVGL